MKIVELARVTAREFLRTRTVAVLIPIFFVYLLASLRIPVVDEAFHATFMERSVFGGVAVIGGMLAILVGTSTISEEIRTGRAHLLVARPLRSWELFLAKAAGGMLAVGWIALLFFASGYLWISLRTDGAPEGSFSYRSAAVVELRDRTLGLGDSALLSGDADEVLFHFDGIRSDLIASDRGEIRLPIRSHPASFDIKIPVRVAIRNPESSSERTLGLTLHRRRTVVFDLETDDISADGRLDVAVSPDGKPCVLSIVEDGIRIRNGRIGFPATFLLHALATTLGLSLLVVIGVAFSTILSAPTGALLLLLLYLLGSVKPFLMDMAASVARGAPTGPVPDWIVRCNASLLRLLAVASPPFDRFHLGEFLARGAVPPGSRILEAVGWFLVYGSISAGVGSWILSRRTYS